MAEQPINSDEIIDKGLFSEAIKSADLFLNKAEDVRVQLAKNLEGSKAYFDSFKGEGAKSLKDLNKETVKVTATLKEYEATQIGIAEVQKRQAQLKAEVAKATREELKLSKDLTKAENDKLKALQKTGGAYKEASNQLNILAKRQKDNTIAGREMSRTARLVADAHLDMKAKIDKADHSVSDFRRNVGNYPKELKAIQRELQNLEPGTEQFNKLAQKAGLLKDAIGDAKDATKAFATESKATTAKTLVGQIGNDIADLDFKGAAEKSAQFASVIKSISFAEVISGIKAFGTAIINVGKSLLANPLVLFIAALAALSYAIYEVVGSFRSLNNTTKTVNEAIKESTKIIEDYANRQIEAIVRINEAQGKFTKEQAERVRLELKENEERKKSAKDYASRVADLAKELGLELGKSSKGRFKENYTGDVVELNNRKHFNLEMVKMERQYLLEQKALVKTQSEEAKALIVEQNADAKKEAEKKAKEAKDEANKRAEERRKDAKEQREKSIKDTEEFDKYFKEIEETSADATAKRIGDEQKKAIEDEKYFNDELLKIQDEADRETRIREAQEAKDKIAKREKELKEAIEFSKQILDLVSKEVAEKSRLKQEGIDKDISDTQKNIETQRNLAQRGLKNTLAEEEARKIQLERQKEEEKIKEIKRQKALAFFKLFASYAEKDPNTALQNALKDTIIAEAVSAAFIDGTENVGKDAQFNGNKFKNGKDGYIAKFDGDERIINPEQNKMIGNLSNEALADLAYKHNNGLLDTVKYGVIQSNDFSSNIANSALLMATMQTNKRLESLEQAIINKPVPNFAFDKYGDFIKETIEGGFSKKTTFKQDKIRI